MIKLYHSSPAKIESINGNGRFGEFLFFSSDSVHGNSETFDYSIEIEESEIIDAQTFFYRDDCKLLQSLVDELMQKIVVDEDTAQDLIAQKKHVIIDLDIQDAELDFDIQLLTARAAKMLGYRGVEVIDEHGTSYMIDMLDQFSELKLIEKD